MKKEMPIGLALIVCDTVIQDRETGKRSLIGMFDRLHARQFPCVHPAMFVYVSATSGRGEYETQIVCRHGQTDKRAFTISGKIRFPDPLQVVELTCHVQGAKFEEPGEYWVELQIDDVPMMMRRLFIEEAPQRPPGQN